MRAAETRSRRKNPLTESRLLLLTSHLIVALCSFHVGLSVGSTSTSVASQHSTADCSFQNKRISEIDSPDVVDISKVTSTGLQKLVHYAARVDRNDFIAHHDFGLPWEASVPGNDQVVMLYSHQSSIPSVNGSFPERTANNNDAFASLPVYTAQQATRNCHELRVVLISPNRENECVALVGQWNAHLVQKLIRSDLATIKNRNKKKAFTYASRLESPHRGIHWHLPKGQALTGYFASSLTRYWQNLPETMQLVQPLAKSAAGKDNTVIVMVCNMGQSELLLNFVCTARSRNLDLGKILLFATDETVYKLAQSLGLLAFEVKDSFGMNLPTKSAEQYGDDVFAGMMMAKVFCVHVINLLGFDLLFQDVDVVWYQNPLSFFLNDTSEYDVFFQDDGNRVSRYAPYSPNTGFYFVRHNRRTEYLFSSLSRMGDLIESTSSHQEVLTHLLSEYASLIGLRVKTFARDSEQGKLFPGGFHYHRRKQFMLDWISGEHVPLIFHMSWTSNKRNKIKFFQQMDDWYVKEECIDTSFMETSELKPLSADCCATQSQFKCHYKDKPSARECRSSPPLDKGRRSFW